MGSFTSRLEKNRSAREDDHATLCGSEERFEKDFSNGVDKPVRMALAQDLVDSDNAKLYYADNYKFVFSDGTELGLSTTDNGYRTDAAPVSSSKGAVLEIRKTKDINRSASTFTEDDYLYFRAKAEQPDGTVRDLELSLSDGDPATLGWYAIGTNTYGFVAKVTTGSRITLYGYDSSVKQKGIRVVETDQGLKIKSNNTTYGLGLEGQLVRVARIPWVN